MLPCRAAMRSLSRAAATAVVSHRSPRRALAAPVLTGAHFDLRRGARTAADNPAGCTCGASEESVASLKQQLVALQARYDTLLAQFNAFLAPATVTRAEDEAKRKARARHHARVVVLGVAVMLNELAIAHCAAVTPKGLRRCSIRCIEDVQYFQLLPETTARRHTKHPVVLIAATAAVRAGLDGDGVWSVVAEAARMEAASVPSADIAAAAERNISRRARATWRLHDPATCSKLLDADYSELAAACDGMLASLSLDVAAVREAQEHVIEWGYDWHADEDHRLEDPDDAAVAAADLDETAKLAYAGEAVLPAVQEMVRVPSRAREAGQWTRRRQCLTRAA